jgi:flagellar biosynthetic protein FliP
MKLLKKFCIMSVALFFVFFLFGGTSLPAAAVSQPGISVNITGTDTPQGTANTLQILFLLTVLSLAPAILIMMTGFTRIVIVLSFVRNALGLQQTPPNQVLIGLALFLTIFMMSPIISQINKEAYIPFTENKITQQQAIDNAMKPLRSFMLKQAKPKDLNLFLSLAKKPKPQTNDEIPTEIIIPAFIIGELKRAFIIGFIIYIPFLVIDMIVASTLMSMGMMMLPPTMISLPFKILLFILVDGWGLTIKTLITSFH